MMKNKILMASTGCLLLSALTISIQSYAATNEQYVFDEQSSEFSFVDGGVDSDNEGFTGSGFINTENTLGASMLWSINANQAGTYAVEIRYANGSDTARAGVITIDEADSQTVAFNSTGAWTSWETETINITLAAGENNILIKATGMDGLANIDKITLTRNDLLSDVSDEQYVLDEQSSEFRFVDGGVDSDNEGFTGSGFINTDNTLGASMLWSINANQAGIYAVDIRYANGGERARAGLITIDGADSQTVTFNSTDAWTSWETETLNIRLAAGDNNILIEATGTDGLANIDKITLTGNSLSDAPSAEIDPPVVEDPVVEVPVIEQPVIDEVIADFELLNVTGNNADLIAGTFTPSNLANLGTQSKLSIQQGGFGTDSVCGLRGEIIKVTNLNDSGPGSLRDAVSQDGPRTIVFEVSGAIKLESNLEINSPFVTIAGQTAPAPGISLYHKTLRVHTHDVCMQHMRVRLGDTDHNLNPISSDDANDADAMVIRGRRDPEGTYNVVLDNMSVSWSIDEAISIFWDVSDITIRDSIIAEPLRNNAHGRAHAYCLFIQDSERVSLIGNVFAHCQRRSPRMNGGTLQYVNNFVYNPGEYAVHAHDDPIDITMVGNVMDFPDDYANRWSDGGAEAFFSSRSLESKVYFQGNESFEDRPLHDDRMQGGPVIVQSEPTVWEGNVIPLTAAKVKQSITDWVGAFPRNRDQVDARVVEGIRTHSGTYLDSEMDTGGYAYVEENNRTLLLPENPQNDDDGDGTSNLVEWLQSYTDAIE